VHEAALVTILQLVMDIIDPSALPEPPKKDNLPRFRIGVGFQACPSKPEGRSRVKESRGRHVVRRR